jgi:hypothetical protein
MKTVSKSVLKAKMFEFFRDLEEHGGELIVTDYGKPVLKITRCTQGLRIDEAFAELRNKAKISREAAIESTEEEWPER